MLIETVGAPAAKWRARNEHLRALVDKHCLEPGGSINVGRLKGNFYLRYFRVPLSTLAALALLAVAAPLMLVIAIAIRLDSPGPIFFRQKRTGLLGRRFEMFKFRTMVINAEAMKEALAHKNVFGSNSPDFKVIDDPRITRIGNFLRRTSLDELPNLLNVLTGDMALVGPRPTSFPIETYAEHNLPRLAITPGITGLWQISGRADVDFDERTRLDVEYINSASLNADFSIILGTFKAVLNGKGAY